MSDGDRSRAQASLQRVVSRCVSKHGAKGTEVAVRVKFGADGKVASVIIGGAERGSELYKCIDRAVRAEKHPAAADSMMTVRVGG